MSLPDTTGPEETAVVAGPAPPSPATGPAARFGLRQTFAALHHPNYRRWFGGQLVSLFGTWMQTTAQGFLVYELTRSPAFLGYVGFAHGLPSWALMLLGGVAADRLPRRSLLVATQTAALIQAALLAVLTFLGLVQPWHVIGLSLLLGVVNAFDAPARQAFVLELVDRERLTNAIALNSTIFHSATTVGPAVAGLLYAAVGPGWCFAANALSFVAVILALLAMRLPRDAPAPREGRVGQQLAAGVRFVVRHRTIRLLLATLGVSSLLGLGMMTLMPAWAVHVLGGDARVNGLLYSARGIGSLGGALMIATLGAAQPRGRLLTSGTLAAPFLMALFAWLRWLPASLVTLALLGWSFMMVFNMCNALVQTQVPDELRGRVMSIYALTFFGVVPLGALLAGTVAARVGAPLTILLNAGGLLVYALVLWLAGPLRGLR